MARAARDYAAPPCHDAFGINRLQDTSVPTTRSLIRDLEKYVLDTETHAIFLLWYYRMVPHRSYVKGWKISPSHYLNQDLATIWLNK